MLRIGKETLYGFNEWISPQLITTPPSCFNWTPTKKVYSIKEETTFTLEAIPKIVLQFNFKRF